MASDQPNFRTVFRGLDRSEVEAYIDELQQRLEAIEEERADLADELGDVPAAKDLETDFDAVGREVTAILQSAREAADAMRERATADAALWRTEAMANAEEMRRDAASDAEAMRRDAWATGTQLLQQAEAYAQKIREQAERDVLTTMGEAEREAHRLTSGARRDAEDLLRNAAMDAEKMTAEAARRRDDMIEAANRQAAAAQERTRALEQRRDELMEELENVRSTLTRLEGSLDERSDGAETRPGDSSSVKVIPPISSQPEHRDWELGETVRVVQTESRIPKLPKRSPVVEPEELELELEVPEVEPTPAEEREPKPVMEDEPMAASVGRDIDEEVESLFASLRTSDESSEEDAEVGDSVDDVGTETHDWLEERDSRLLPITNRALRGIKKSITELQNIALDQLRTDGGWSPDPGEIADILAADLIALWAESFAVGHGVAEQMTGVKLKRPPTPHSDSISEFSQSLAQAIGDALDSAGDGQRERQSAASRVFRIWRSDEAEQRVREMAIKGYQLGVERSVSVEV